jgi:hypothetical protein
VGIDGRKIHVYKICMNCGRRESLLFAIRDEQRSIGASGGVVVTALRYEPAGRGFDSR